MLRCEKSGCYRLKAMWLRSLSGRIVSWQNFERVQQTILNVGTKPIRAQLINTDFGGQGGKV